jgi:hypothetical protein
MEMGNPWGRGFTKQMAKKKTVEKTSSAVVLCSGPSIEQFTGSADLLIGVNRGAILKPCTHWVCLDRCAQADTDPAGGLRGWADQVQGTPHLLTKRETVRSCPWRGETSIVEDWWKDYEPGTLGWSIFSATTAVMWAAHMGATQIEIYGMDLAGKEDADGVNPSSTRSDAQWERQRETLAGITEWLKAKGVEVVRHGPA